MKCEQNSQYVKLSYSWKFYVQPSSSSIYVFGISCWAHSTNLLMLLASIYTLIPKKILQRPSRFMHFHQRSKWWFFFANEKNLSILLRHFFPLSPLPTTFIHWHGRWISCHPHWHQWGLDWMAPVNLEDGDDKELQLYKKAKEYAADNLPRGR